QRDAAFDDELLHELWAPPAAHYRTAGRALGKRNSHLHQKFEAAVDHPATKANQSSAPVELNRPRCNIRCSLIMPASQSQSQISRQPELRTSARPGAVR